MIFGEGFDSLTGSLDSVADLRRNGFVVEPDDMEPEQGEDDCLCGVDVEAILDRSGRPYEEDDCGYRMTT